MGAHTHTHTHAGIEKAMMQLTSCQSSHLSCFSEISRKMASLPSSFIVPRLKGDEGASSPVAQAKCPISPRWHQGSLGMRRDMAVRDKGVLFPASMYQSLLLYSTLPKFMTHYFIMACCRLEQGSERESEKKRK